MNTIEIANQLVEWCKVGKNDDAVVALFAEDAVSIEAAPMPDGTSETVGIAGIRAKGDWWRDNHEVHAASVTGPWPHGDRFIVGYHFDVTNKPSGQRMVMDEAGLYTVKHGKIVLEEFFYST
jgi:hypothetical protein